MHVRIVAGDWPACPACRTPAPQDLDEAFADDADDTVSVRCGACRRLYEVRRLVVTQYEVTNGAQ